MKVRSVTYSNRKKVFVVKTARRTFTFPYAKAEPKPTSHDLVRKAFVDREVAREGFTYELESGTEGTILMDQILDYNRDPSYLRDTHLYNLTVEAQRRIAKSALSKREIIRRLGTSATQLYRLLDQTNYGKTVDQMIALLEVLDCRVDLVVRPRTA